MMNDNEIKGRVGGAAWSVEDIPYDAIDASLIHDNAELFYLLAAASFVEITSDLYTRNLIEFYPRQSRDRELARQFLGA